MSAKVILSTQARIDFRDILSHTVQTWGDRQRTLYQQKIDKALCFIAEHPYAWQQYAEKLHVLSAEKHRIFYRVSADSVLVLRILHQRMQPEGYLETPEEGNTLMEQKKQGYF